MSELTDEELDISQVVADAEAESIPPEMKVKRLSSLCRDLIALEGDLEALEKAVREKKDEIKKLSEEQIPDLMDELDIDEFRLKNGLKVRIKPFYSGKIESPECYEWLEENGYSDIIKGAIQVPYPRDFDKSKLRAIVEVARELGLSADNQEGVHHSTLNGWIREMIESGKEFPRELFNVYVGRRTKIGLK